MLDSLTDTLARDWDKLGLHSVKSEYKPSPPRLELPIALLTRQVIAILQIKAHFADNKIQALRALLTASD